MIDKRRNSRVAADAVADCSIRDRALMARVSDLSVCGCRLQFSEAEMTVGDDILIRFDIGIEARGEIAWGGLGVAGIEFSKRLHEAAVRHLDLDKFAGANWIEVPPLPRPVRGRPSIL